MLPPCLAFFFFFIIVIIIFFFFFRAATASQKFFQKFNERFLDTRFTLFQRISLDQSHAFVSFPLLRNSSDLSSFFFFVEYECVLLTPSFFFSLSII